MKKKYIISFITVSIIILLLIVINQYNNNYKITNLNNINKTIVKIIPEKTLTQYSNNPSGVLEEDEYGIGSGFFIDEEGKILTSLHNISNENIDYYAIDYNNKRYKIQIINIDKQKDLALLQIDSKTKNFYLGINNKQININDNIYSLGIKGEEKKISSQTGTIIGINDFIEFTPQIFNGFSGGPILNNNFEVIGINYGIGNGRSYGVEIE